MIALLVVAGWIAVCALLIGGWTALVEVHRRRPHVDHMYGDALRMGERYVLTRDDRELTR